MKQPVRATIANEEFSLHIQPFYDLNTGKIAGGEILTRWIKNGEEIPPAEFFSQLDNPELGCELDYHVFASAMPTLAAITAKMGSEVPISFNISGQHFNSTGFAERVEALAEAFDVDKSTILFEIKADLLETRNENILRQLSDLREAGFRIVVDEIKGDSRSLMVIESGLVDMVKMERAFVARCVDTGFGQELLKLLLETTGKFGIKMICTGVETEQQRDFLKKYGCNYAQGFLLSKPVSLREFEVSAF